MDSRMMIREPTAQHCQTIIFLHGRDSTASDFEEELFESESSDKRTFLEIFPATKWVFPTAPILRAARYGHVAMSQWFDMWSTEDPHERDDEQQFSEQVAWVQRIIAEEAQIIGAENLFLAGISQGCAIGTRALLTQEQRLAGLIGLCSWFPQESTLRAIFHPAALKTPVFLGHHTDDDVINIKYGRELRDKLTDMGMQVSWHSYSDQEQEIKHWLNEPRGVDDIVEFIKKKMPGRDYM